MAADLLVWLIYWLFGWFIKLAEYWLVDCLQVFGHGGPSAAPVSRNYPEMRERLRLLLNKKKRSHKTSNQAAAAAAKTTNQAAAAAKPSNQVPVTAVAGKPPTTAAVSQPAAAVKQLNGEQGPVKPAIVREESTQIKINTK